MNCRKARKSLALFAGDDLPREKSSKIAAHVEHCPSCRRELAEYRRALAKARELAVEEKEVASWPESEWAVFIKKAIPGKPAQKAFGERLKPVWLWVPAFALVLTVGLLVLGRIPLSRPEGQARAARDVRAENQGGNGPGGLPAGQDVVAMTLVSQETGLKVVWFLHKNFE
ncbi:MAG TPA: hypothetical protein PLX50_02685 [Candidatus Aminicenantes bacterium]|nr:hypothetical protein [Candidatus Aminicenantes bacterium]